MSIYFWTLMKKGSLILLFEIVDQWSMQAITKIFYSYMRRLQDYLKIQIKSEIT